MPSFININETHLTRAYAWACCSIILVFTLLAANYNFAMRDTERVFSTDLAENSPLFRNTESGYLVSYDSGTLIHLSSTATTVLFWTLTFMILATGIIGTIKKNPVIAIGPFILYMICAELFGGMYFVPSSVDEILGGAILLCFAVAAYRKHPVFVADRSPDDASTIGTDAGTHSPRVAGISRSPRG